ncbi:type IX secretion system membrane protein PorP/SprF [Flavobacterium sp. LC2016-12]|uniref:PorP/SprF family type IX secretion system membrane protein n=1 Tax=Flavobacterium sp. LC2016-12 TaxID=2783794 RepID=UPI00188A2466|nr:type IX secretion system membrane protein PorP/SprF [Flavobacterium sp. LC2016-12]MBF4464384.1 type IX secretion system membrane protein PorP/SprF [Flavobacterium sp. LC2016-12]
MGNTFKKIIFLIAIIIFSIHNIKAQNDAKLSIFNYNPLFYNPAFAGSADGLNIVGIYSTQWVGFDGAPKTQYLSADTKSLQKIGYGISLYNDVAGPKKEYNIEGNFAYYIKLDRKYKLVLGVKGGINSYSINKDNLDIYEPGEVVDNFGTENKTAPIFGVGANFYSDKFFIGISSPNIIQAKYSSIGTILSQRKNYYYSNFGYQFEIERDITLTPALLARITAGAPVSILTSLNLNWRNKYLASVNFDYNSSVGAFAGIQIIDDLKIGYGYDISTTKFSNYNNGSHTFFLSYTLLNENSEKCTCHLY